MVGLNAANSDAKPTSMPCWFSCRLSTEYDGNSWWEILRPNQSINLYGAIVQRRMLQCSYAESKRHISQPRLWGFKNCR